eukprot:12910303-Prorocentrum_lima.AAC.1
MPQAHTLYEPPMFLLPKRPPISTCRQACTAHSKFAVSYHSTENHELASTREARHTTPSLMPCSANPVPRGI